MADVETLTPAEISAPLNVADRLTAVARRFPNVTAVVCPRRWSPAYRGTNGTPQQSDSAATYATTTFAELDADATLIARGLLTWGVPKGSRLALLVRPGIEFVTLVFALLRAGMVVVLVDPGLGRRNLVRCLTEAEPEGFVAIGLAQAARLWLRRKFPRARWNVTVGRRWFWGGMTLGRLRELGAASTESAALIKQTRAGDAAAIIFTSGSTGAPKGVLYTQRMFDTQVSEIQSAYGIEPGGVDLACFPLFALFNLAMGVTTVLPEMDFSRPAAANPVKLLTAANDWQVTQAFASPAVWRMLSRHCAQAGARIDSLQQVFSCGAPVTADVLRVTLECVGKGAEMHTPYGATECLPVATIEAAELLSETAARTDEGAGVCIGRKFGSLDWSVIRITDEPIASFGDAEELPIGEIGELVVRGPQVSPRYVTRTEANAVAKMENERDGTGPWHRIGDVGYFDTQQRFWYCGRKSQRVETAAGPLYTECVEAVFNTHASVRRSALVGVGPRGKQVPVLVVELQDANDRWYESLLAVAQSNPVTQSIRQMFKYPSLPVDIRHNAKINREQLAIWAADQIRHMPECHQTQATSPSS